MMVVTSPNRTRRQPAGNGLSIRSSHPPGRMAMVWAVIRAVMWGRMAIRPYKTITRPGE